MSELKNYESPKLVLSGLGIEVPRCLVLQCSESSDNEENMMVAPCASFIAARWKLMLRLWLG